MGQGAGHVEFIGYHSFFFGILEFVKSSSGIKGIDRSREGPEKEVVRRNTLNMKLAMLKAFNHEGSRVQKDCFLETVLWQEGE